MNFFGEFIVSKTYVVDKYVPKKNEKMEIENKNIYVENIPFLLKQKIFGGKAFDIVIVRFFGNKAIIYCFQITGHKKKEDLMKYDELEKNIKTMIKYLKNYFSFEIVSVYFSYIFNYANHYEKKIIKMCEDLDTRNIRYIFYDIYSEIYYDKYFNEVSEIGKTMSEFNFNSDEKMETGNYNLNKFQTLEIINILKKIYKTNKISFKLFKKDSLNPKDLTSYSLFCITEIVFNYNIETFMFYLENEEYKSVLLNKNGGSYPVERYVSILTFFKKFVPIFEWMKRLLISKGADIKIKMTQTL